MKTIFAHSLFHSPGRLLGPLLLAAALPAQRAHVAGTSPATHVFWSEGERHDATTFRYDIGGSGKAAVVSLAGIVSGVRSGCSLGPMRIHNLMWFSGDDGNNDDWLSRPVRSDGVSPWPPQSTKSFVNNTISQGLVDHESLFLGAEDALLGPTYVLIGRIKRNGFQVNRVVSPVNQNNQVGRPGGIDNRRPNATNRIYYWVNGTDLWSCTSAGANGQGHRFEFTLGAANGDHVRIGAAGDVFCRGWYQQSPTVGLWRWDGSTLLQIETISMRGGPVPPFDVDDRGGDHVYYATYSQLRVMDPDGTNKTLLFENPGNPGTPLQSIALMWPPGTCLLPVSSPIGSGCYPRPATFYEGFAPGGFDLSLSA